MAIATLKVQKGKDTPSMPKLLHFSELFCTASPHFANIVGRHGSSHSHWTLETSFALDFRNLYTAVT